MFITCLRRIEPRLLFWLAVAHLVMYCQQMHVFPGERFKYNPLHESVPNTFLGRTKNGWMDTELFYMWLANHFVVHIPPARPVILLVDGHSTHIDIQITKFCQGNQNNTVLFASSHQSPSYNPLMLRSSVPLK